MNMHAPAIVAAFAAFAVALLLAAPAGASDTTQVTSFDPTGAVFTCPGGDFTVLGGTVKSVYHDSYAADGSEHVTGTITPVGVTLTDGTTNVVYRLAGASWFGGNFNPANGRYEFADTEHFNILGPQGVVATVAGVEHMGSGGANFSFAFGPCQAPQD